MVDRADLIKRLELRVRPTGSQVDAIRKAMDKTLAELLLALPLAGFRDLPQASKADLIEMVGLIDPKICEKLAASWEPKRKLDAELKPRVKKDLVALMEGKRRVYEPISKGLTELQNGDRGSIKELVQSGLPIKDLKALTKKWDKNWKPSRESRAAYEERLLALIDGAAPATKSSR